jgi:hypothetical protein
VFNVFLITWLLDKLDRVELAISVASCEVHFAKAADCKALANFVVDLFLVVLLFNERL